MGINITEITAQETLAIRKRVMWPNKPVEFVMLDNDTKGIHFGLWKDEKMISIVSLFVEGDSAQFRKFATEIDMKGNGYGTLLLDHLMRYVTVQKIKKVWCNARVDKTGFYEKFGMCKTTTTFKKASIEYVIMEKMLS